MHDIDQFTHYKRITPTGIKTTRPITSSTRLILREAKRLGIDVKQIENTQIFELSYKDQIRHFHFQNPGSNTATAMFITNNKRIMRNLLAEKRISIPKGYAIEKKDPDAYLKEIFDALKKPLVIKPSEGSQGKGITVGVETLFEYILAIKKAFRHTHKSESWIIVEEQLEGFSEYRVLATRSKVIGVINRVPANVVGDGISNIRQLIKRKNDDPRRGDKADHPPLFTLELDEDMKEFLLKQGLNWKSVPQKGEVIYLRGVSNISMGGDSLDFTDKAHQSVKDICLKALNHIPGLFLGGVDFMTTDITKVQTPESYAILEVNNSPGIDIHDFPYVGENRHAGQAFLEELFGQNF